MSKDLTQNLNGSLEEKVDRLNRLHGEQVELESRVRQIENA
jgi:hypothetical protein